MRPIKLLSSIILLISLSFMSVKSEIVKNIEILGNERVSNETILMFSDVNINDDLTENRINSILKSLYETNFFKDVSVSFNSSKLSITVIENPIIQSITYNGIKSTTLKEKMLKNVKLKSRSSYNEFEDEDYISWYGYASAGAFDSGDTFDERQNKVRDMIIKPFMECKTTQPLDLVGRDLYHPSASQQREWAQKICSHFLESTRNF